MNDELRIPPPAGVPDPKKKRRCPRCPEHPQLLDDHIGTHRTLACSRCRGIWIRVRDLMGLKDTGTIMEAVDAAKGQNFAALVCPDCVQGLSTVRATGAVDPVEVDVCPTCCGFWLDRGEFEQLVDKAARTPPSTRPPDTLGALSVNELVGEILLSAVGAPGQQIQTNRGIMYGQTAGQDLTMRAANSAVDSFTELLQKKFPKKPQKT